MKTPTYIPCKSYLTGNPFDGIEYDCEYHTDIDCGDCICCTNNFGYINPITGYQYSEKYVQKYVEMFGNKNIE